jgi:hypothetical protein
MSTPAWVEKQEGANKYEVATGKILYMGASKCYVSIPEDSFASQLAYVSPLFCECV